MRKLYISIFMVGCAIAANAQSRVANQSTLVNIKPLNLNADRVADTLEPASHSATCFTADPQPLTLYSGATIGYISGTNSYSDPEKGQQYTLASGSNVTGTIIGFYANNASNPNITIKLYPVVAGVPAASAVATSNPVGLGSFSGSPFGAGIAGFHTFSFTPFSITGDVLFSVTIPTGGSDTLALLSTKDDCMEAGDKSWELWDNGGTLEWATLAANWQIAAGNPLNVDLAIYPIIDGPVGIPAVEKNGLTLNNAYPNPVNNLVNFGFNLDQTEEVVVEIMDLTGKVISTVNLGTLSEGKQRYIYDASSLANGAYLYSISTNKSKLVSRFTVAH